MEFHRVGREKVPNLPRVFAPDEREVAGWQ
jgi:hypothetical protein